MQFMLSQRKAVSLKLKVIATEWSRHRDGDERRLLSWRSCMD